MVKWSRVLRHCHPVGRQAALPTLLGKRHCLMCISSPKGWVGLPAYRQPYVFSISSSGRVDVINARHYQQQPGGRAAQCPLDDHAASGSGGRVLMRSQVARGKSARRQWHTRIRYDTIRDAILRCARKPTWVSLIYRTQPTTKKCKNRKNWK